MSDRTSSAKGDTFGTSFCLGFEDRHVNCLLRVEQLYRYPWTNRLGWRLGWELANFLTSRPLRTARHG